MRSMYVSMLALALTVLLCACVSNVPVWETVDDAQVCQGESRLPSTIVFAVPDGAAVQTFSPPVRRRAARRRTARMRLPRRF